MSTFRQCDVERLVRSAVAVGLTVEAVEISPEGAIRVLTTRPAPGVPVNDDRNWIDLAGQTTAHARA